MSGEWIPASTSSGSLLRLSVAGWFASTVVLPASVNKCDTLWEQHGLKNALANALRRIVTSSTLNVAPQSTLSTAFELFRQGSRTALADAQGHNRAQLVAEKLPSKQRELATMSAILNLYAQELGQFSPTPTITSHLSVSMTRQYSEALQTVD